MRARGFQARRDVPPKLLEVGALAGQVIKACAAVLRLQSDEAVVTASRYSGQGPADAGGGCRSNGDGDTRRTDSSGIGCGDSEATAGRLILGRIFARGGVRGDGTGNDGDLAGLDALVGNRPSTAHRGSSGRNEGSDSRGAVCQRRLAVMTCPTMSRPLPLRGSYPDLQEAGAVGRSRLKGEEASAGTGDLAIAVVARAVASFKDGTHGQAGKRENDGGLHIEKENIGAVNGCLVGF